MHRLRNVSVRWRLLMVAVMGPLLVGGWLAWQRIAGIREMAETAVIEKSRAIVMMAEAGRSEMGKKLKMGMIRPFSELSGAALMETVPVVAAMKMAAENADKAGYEFRAPKDRPRNPANTPDAVEAAVLARFRNGETEEVVIREAGRIRYFRPIRLTSDCMVCHGDPAGSVDPVGGIREGWKVGEVHGAFEIISDMTLAETAARNASLHVVAWLAGILLCVAGSAWWVLRRSVLSPIAAADHVIQHLGKGDLTVTMPAGWGGEFSAWSEMLNGMGAALATMMTDLDGGQETLRERAATLEAIGRNLRKAAENSDKDSTRVDLEATHLKEQIHALAAAAEETAVNFRLLADASERMAVSADQIAQMAIRARNETHTALASARNAETEMGRLGDAAEEIGSVTEAIEDIAERIDMLALNATIVAARSGEAGKGFSVVAGEVMQLARESAEATVQIQMRVRAIQSRSKETAETMAGLSTAFDTVFAVVEGIAEAVDRQANATREMAGAVGNAAVRMETVASSIGDGSEKARMMAGAVGHLAEGATLVAKESSGLTRQSAMLEEAADGLRERLSRFRF